MVHRSAPRSDRTPGGRSKSPSPFLKGAVARSRRAPLQARTEVLPDLDAQEAIEALPSAPSAALRRPPPLAQVPAEYYVGSPWEDCEDIACEDLAEFFARSLEKSQDCESFTRQDSQPSVFASLFGWGGEPEKSTVASNVVSALSWSAVFVSHEKEDGKRLRDDASDRFSIGAASTASSLGGSSRPSTTPSTARPSVEAVFLGKHSKQAPGSVAAQDSAEDDWEVEFMLRSTVETKAKGPEKVVQLRKLEQIVEAECQPPNTVRRHAAVAQVSPACRVPSTSPAAAGLGGHWYTFQGLM